MRAFFTIIAVLLSPSLIAQSSHDPLVGKFSSADLSIVIKPASNGYSGTISMDGENYPFAARRADTGFCGTFQGGDEKFEFTGKIEGETLTLRTGDSSYTLQRAVEKKNPLDRKNAKNVPAASDQPAETVEVSWKTFQHPFGLSLRHPADWKLQEAPDGAGFLLLPPGLLPGGDEIYLLGGQPAGDIATADDPRLAVAAEQLMAQTAPLLQRSGPVEKVRATTNPGISLAWENRAGARARMFVTILKGQAIGITGLGVKDKVKAREPMLQKIFETLSAGEFARDPRLVGAWRRMGTTSLDARDNAGRLQASSVGDHQHLVQLRADGTCTSREVSRSIAIGQGVSIDTGDQVETKTGQWYAGDARLGLLWENAAPEEYAYEISGAPGSHQLIIKLDASRGQVWAQAR